METDQLAGILGQGGVTAALIWVIYRVGLALVAKIEKLATSIDEHTRRDLAAHAEVREDLAVLTTRVQTAIGLTPARGIHVVSTNEGGDR